MHSQLDSYHSNAFTQPWRDTVNLCRDRWCGADDTDPDSDPIRCQTLYTQWVGSLMVNHGNWRGRSQGPRESRGSSGYQPWIWCSIAGWAAKPWRRRLRVSLSINVFHRLVLPTWCAERMVSCTGSESIASTTQWLDRCLREDGDHQTYSYTRCSLVCCYGCAGSESRFTDYLTEFIKNKFLLCSAVSCLLRSSMTLVGGRFRLSPWWRSLYMVSMVSEPSLRIPLDMTGMTSSWMQSLRINDQKLRRCWGNGEKSHLLLISLVSESRDWREMKCSSAKDFGGNHAANMRSCLLTDHKPYHYWRHLRILSWRFIGMLCFCILNCVSRFLRFPMGFLMIMMVLLSLLSCIFPASGYRLTI